MANDYYENTANITPFTTADPAEIDADLDAIEAGFDKLPQPHAGSPGTKGFAEPFVAASATDDTHAAPVSQIRVVNFGVDTGSANVYEVALDPPSTALATGMVVMFKPVATNTGACTLNVDSHGVKSIKATDGTNPAANAIYAGQVAVCIYDGTNFQLVTQSLVSMAEPSVTIPPVANPGEIIIANDDATAYIAGHIDKNRACNAEMLIDQRTEGVGLTESSTNGSAVVDRWRIQRSLSGGTYTAMQTTGFAGHKNSVKITMGTGNGAMGAAEYLAAQYSFRGHEVGDVSNKDVTIAIWFKSNATGTFALTLQTASSAKSYISTFSYQSAGVEQLVIVTVPVSGAATTMPTDGTEALKVIISGLSGSTYQGTAGSWLSGNKFCTSGCVDWAATNGNYIQFTGFLFTTGGYRPIEFKSFAEYLAECLPFCWNIGYGETSRDVPLVSGTKEVGATACIFPMTFPVRMVSAPSFSYSGSFGVLEQGGVAAVRAVTGITLCTDTIGTVAFDGSGLFGATLKATVGALASLEGEILHLATLNAGSGRLIFDTGI